MSMDIEKSRAEFEAWFESINHFHPEKTLGPVGFWYSDPRTDDAWSIWKASRAALVVELPTTELTGSIGIAHRTVTKRCAEAIRAAGIKIKGDV